jgi:predicted Ser/Thr protein kinase
MTTSRLQPGDPVTLGHYRVVGRLGEGGMGSVFLALDPAGAKVALKVIKAELVRDPRARARFVREVAAARKVARFCTARVLDADLVGQRPYVVTEYIDGPNLQEVVEGRGPLGSAGLETLAVGVLTALAAIHAAGVVHRDLKPANVLLSAVGPRVIDFGIAGAVEGTSDLTAAGHAVGTPAYMAPEQVNGGKVGPAADVFAWGCLLTYAATGRPPFQGDNLAAVVWKIVNQAPDLDGVDPELRPLLERALTKDQAARPSARELLEGLLHEPERPADPVGRADLVATGEAAVSRAWPAALGEVGPTVTAARVAAAPVPPRPRSALRWVGAAALAAILLAGIVVGGSVLFNLAILGHLIGATAEDAPPTPPTTTRAPSGKPKGGVIGRARAPAPLLASWRAHGSRKDCPPVLPLDLGAGAGASIRQANFFDVWAVAWDKPGFPGVRAGGDWCKDCGRGAFGIAALDPVTRADLALPRHMDLGGGWRAAYGSSGRPGDSSQPVSWDATVTWPGGGCGYSVWSYHSQAQLEAMLASLAVVDPNA